MSISSLNSMCDLLLESSHRDDSNNRSNIVFGHEIMELASIEVYFTHVTWSSGTEFLSYLFWVLINCVFPERLIKILSMFHCQC